MRKYLVTKDRKSKFSKNFKLKKGEKIYKLKEYSPEDEPFGWILCRKKRNKLWIPYQIIKKIDNKGILKENYSFKELNIKKNEIIIEIKTMNGWLMGKKEGCNKKMGWIPLNYLKRI